MKFGICADWKKPGRLEAVKAAGADFVELNFSTFKDADAGEIAALKARLDALDLPVGSYNGMLPGTCRITGKDRDHGAAAEFVRSVIEKVQILGGRHVVLGSSAARRMEEGSDPETAINEFTSFLKDYLAPILQKYGWVCSIEPLSECNFLRTTADGLAIVKAIDRLEIRLLADYYHLMETNEPAHAILKTQGYLRHVHIASKDGRLAPKNTDPDDYQGFLKDLDAIGYTGGVSVEGRFPDPYADSCREAICTLRALPN